MRGNPIQQQKYNEKVTKAADSFWGAFQMTENGKVKSTLMLYSFCLAWLFIFVYGALFFFLLDPLDAVLAGLPVTAVNLLEALIPSAGGVRPGMVFIQNGEAAAAGSVSLGVFTDAGLPHHSADLFKR